jgi:signal transduction histidine kinase
MSHAVHAMPPTGRDNPRSDMPASRMVGEERDAYVSSMSAETATTRTTVPVTGFLIQPFTARTWKETLYLLLSMPVGIVTFVVLVTGLATGAGLLITLLGIPIIWLTFLLARGLADLERMRARALLDADVARLYLPDAQGWWKRLISRTEDPSTWMDIVYGILLLPVGVFTFAITVTVWTLGLASALLPLYYWALPKSSTSSGTGIVVFSSGVGQRTWVVDTAPEIAAVALFGVLVVLLTPWIVRGMASASRGLVQAMLGGGASRQMSKRVRELTDSRTSAVDLAAADRRQIERDLHDGVQQRLVALAIDLGRAQEKFDRDPEGAKALLDEAHVEAKRALGEVRDLARGIYPAVLTDRGLDPALSALAARCPIPVDVSVEVEPRPPASAESAAYFVVSEALANIAKHARATRASVTVRRARDAWLTIQVQDDGIGGADPAEGTGLAGLRERVSTLDGEFHLLSPEGGPTVVHVELPCAS